MKSVTFLTFQYNIKIVFEIILDAEFIQNLFNSFLK